MRRPIVNELLVAQVDDNPDAAARSLLRDDREIVLGNQHTGRVARGIDDDALRPGSHRMQNRLRPNREAVLQRRSYEHRRRFGQLDLLAEGRPVWRVGDDLVAWIEERQRRVEERLLAAGADDDLRFLVLHAVVDTVPIADRAPQLGDARYGGVLGETPIEGGVGGRGDMGRGGEIGLTRSEVDDFSPLLPQPIDRRGHLHRRRAGNARGAVGEARHGPFSLLDHRGDVAGPLFRIGSALPGRPCLAAAAPPCRERARGHGRRGRRPP